MKTKKISKLMFNKSTIADLNHKEMGDAHGGSITVVPPTLDRTVCRTECATYCVHCPTDATCITMDPCSGAG